MPFEMIEHGEGNSPKGTFAPQADQKQFVSAFGLVEGNGGWTDGRALENGIVTQDGRARLGFAEFKDEKGKPHTVKINGRVLREYFAPRADAEAKEKYDAGLSNAVVETYMRPQVTPATSSQIGRTNFGGLQMHDEVVNIPAKPAA